MTRVIDVHNHLFPEEWIYYLEKRSEFPKMKRTINGMTFYSHGVSCAHIINPGHYDLDARIEDMDRCNINTQILSLTLPSVDELPAEEGVEWAKRINDYFAEICQKYPGRFYAFATLPFQDVKEAVKELERAYKKLGVKGITMFSNVNFKPISSPEFFPIYEKAEEYSLPIFIHPGVPFTKDIMEMHKLRMSLYGFTLDTTIAVMSLIWQGVMEKFSKLKIIHAHLGGVVPYLVQRMEDCWNASLRFNDLNQRLPRTPSEYYKENVYPDSMSAYLPAMKCCLEFVGSDHICLGTDYPHSIGNWEQAIEYVKRLGLSQKETDAILGRNAAKICNIEE